jgi:hypothetical protein
MLPRGTRIKGFIYTPLVIHFVELQGPIYSQLIQKEDGWSFITPQLYVMSWIQSDKPELRQFDFDSRRPESVADNY